MLARLGAWFRRWRERRRQYQIQRALYKQGGGTRPPSTEASFSRYGPPAVTHDTDLSDLSEDT